MRSLLIFLLISGNLIVYSQQWQTIPSQSLTGTNSFCTGPYINKNFKVNPYNNSVWMTKYAVPYYIRYIDDLGVFHEYSYLNEPLFSSFSNFNDIEFTTTKSFVYSPNSGFFTFDGINWNLDFAINDGYTISSDADTVWMARSSSGPYFKWAAASMSTGTASFKRIQSKNGNMWISSGDWNIIGTFKEGVGPVFHSPDTSFLLSWQNHDFKFQHNSDTLYVAGDLGFSLAVNGYFVDTITPGNSINMPGSLITEFEFDPQDNIWAVFGSGTTVLDSSISIAYYDRSLNEWTQVYNSSNSPISFDGWVTIEVDSSGNLWATDGGDIYVLKINNWPSWLDVQELDQKSFSIHPNPTSDYLKIDGIHPNEISSIRITDLSGNFIERFIHPTTVDFVNVSGYQSGVYFISIETTSGSVTTQKWIKE